MNKIKVFIIDDSAVVREILTEKLSKHPQIQVVGSAMDPYIARDKLEKLDVDVITLDIELPRMDGLTFLKYLMKYRPIPTIIVSSITENSNKAAMTALELGAVDIVPKPGGPFSIEEVIELLIDRIKTASQTDFTKLQRYSRENQPLVQKTQGRILSSVETTHKLIAIGASTGGTQAMEVLFKDFGKDFPATLAVIHMPEKFTATFAYRLNDLCQAAVKEAENGEKILPGTIYIAPGGLHMEVRTVGSERFIRIANGPKVCNQRPAVDVLFNSVAEHIGKNSVAALLTGMGKDGAAGLLRIRQAGGHTIAQDEESSIVFGMPKEAIALNAAQEVLPLDRIAGSIRRKTVE